MKLPTWLARLLGRPGADERRTRGDRRSGVERRGSTGGPPDGVERRSGGDRRSGRDRRAGG